MKMRKNMIRAAAMSALVAVAAAAHAASDADMCESTKLKASGKFTSCSLGTDAKAQTKGETPVYTKCDEAQGSTFGKAEAKYGLDCPSQSDASSVRTSLASIASCVSGNLGGDAVNCSLGEESLCGNGVIDAGETCDQGAFAGESCGSASAGAKPFGTLRCGADCHSFDTSSCVACASSQSTLYAGKCWILGAPAQSCTDVCTAAGLAYDAATDSVAGSTGTLAHCAGILSRIQNTGTSTIADDVANPGVGCYMHGLGYYRRDTAPADAGSTYSLGQRACACS